MHQVLVEHGSLFLAYNSLAVFRSVANNATLLVKNLLADRLRFVIQEQDSSLFLGPRNPAHSDSMLWSHEG